ncbi:MULTISPECIES: substrate-binding domain-containing protein [Providencia]|uniref:substrate-binding domain-containing protein n=1 Tax=Providencia TaxID=586 RepID=UPI0019817416|nr:MULTISPECIES: substrate-binding domain-containing protein [Providencia]MBN4864411.1 LacI family DNA-binding transcriptional regulator [Providencia stuartii]MBN4874142.1 LacI family DNA-binding transcriptional regulator [Providencia stuartii]MBN4878833.1 LacI family DNA-binding transcriptional regulator [Providencia stuartii]MBN4882934.1 LacI family DNA-binding transcriptional regulator [Providencia stuartii]HEM8292877.1 LacI family DNA-binding transcriptional regulator [Providencia stuartii
MAKTVEQIANDLNLSVTTVRLVLSQKAEQYRISKATQERIQSYVETHGLVVNYAARSLKLNKTDTLALVVPRLSNLFFSTLAEKLETCCQKAGYQLIIACSYSDPKHEKEVVRSLLERNVDGLFIVPSSLETQLHHRKLARKRPIIFLDRDFGEMDVPLVLSDNYSGSKTLVQSIKKAVNVEPLFFIAGDTQQPSIQSRLQGYLNEMPERQSWVLTARHNRKEDGQHLMHEFLKKNKQPPSAFITSSLPILEGTLSALRQVYGFIPQEIPIGTFDESDMLGFLPNAVWSMGQNEDAWAQHAFHLMQNKLQGDKSNVKITVPMTLIYRPLSVARDI